MKGDRATVVAEWDAAHPMKKAHSITVRVLKKPAF
jgi:hypothetical protein